MQKYQEATQDRVVLDLHDETARNLVEGHAGRLVKTTGDGILATLTVRVEQFELRRLFKLSFPKRISASAPVSTPEKLSSATTM